MVALHTKKLSSDKGLALHPSGGSLIMDLRSDMSRSCADDDAAAITFFSVFLTDPKYNFKPRKC
uniref:Ubiquitin-conjugating enzyme E2 1-like n=1 Tax=Rhizophora mucronata TaxID=61149 RepID=A0A2P2M6Y3_RHIMU